MSQKIEVPEEITGKVNVEWPNDNKGYDPYIIQIGNELIVEFDDWTCQTIRNVWVMRGGRRVHVFMFRSTSEMRVRVEVEHCEGGVNVWTKRDSVIEVSNECRQQE